MIVLNIKLDNIYGFNDFEINFSYPKKVVNSFIEDEHLENRPRFRYKKAIVLMGANATGKTSLGRALLHIFRYIETGNDAVLYEMVSGNGSGTFAIDFVNQGYTLHRLSAVINVLDENVEIKYHSAEIQSMDSYEKCVGKLIDHTEIIFNNTNTLKKNIGPFEYRFAYPEIERSLNISEVDQRTLLKTLRAVIGTLDPTLQDVSIAKDLKNSFVIRRSGEEIIIQEGRLLNREMLSSGTVEGIDVAVFLASMKTLRPCFYYCDEHFSFIHSDIEKRIFGLMLGRLKKNEQMIFTTHNSDMLDLNLPKHAFGFLRKQREEDVYRISAVFASDILKRNTDSVRSAVENDSFLSSPDDSLLDELEMDNE